MSCQAGPTVPRTRSVHHSAGSYPYRQARQGLAARFSCPSTPKTLQYSMLTATERGCSQSKYVAAKISRSSVRVLRSCAVAGKAIRRVARASGKRLNPLFIPRPFGGSHFGTGTASTVDPVKRSGAQNIDERRPLPLNRACPRSRPASPSIPMRGRTPCDWGPCPGAVRPHPQIAASGRRTAGPWSVPSHSAAA